jgi:hypothetical protein
MEIEEIRKNNGLIFRQDITDFLIEKHIKNNPNFKFDEDDENYLHKWFVFEKKKWYVFEKNNRLFHPNYSGTKLDYFSTLSDFLSGHYEKLSKEIERKFVVEIIREPNIYICDCGLDSDFSARIEGYELLLKCKCGNEFSAYSG